MDTMIMAMGFLEDIATDEEVRKSYEKEYGMDNMITYDDYIRNEKFVNNEGENESENYSENDSENDSEETTEETTAEF
jgi:hypothetical protein